MTRGVSIKPIAQFVAAAIACYLSARLSFHLGSGTLSAGAAWLPASIALAAIMAAGTPAAPGVALGLWLAFLPESHAGMNTAALGAAGIAMGQTAQALLAARLLRDRAGLGGSLPRAGSVHASAAIAQTDADAGLDPRVPVHLAIRIFAILFLSSLLAPTIGVGSLALASPLDGTSILSAWQGWWPGSLAGLLLGPSIGMLIRNARTRASEPVAGYITGALAAVAAGIIGAILVTQNQRDQALATLVTQTEGFAADLQTALADQVLRADAIAALVASQGEPDREAFGQFAREVLTSHGHDIVLSVGYLPRVTEAERPAWEIEARADGVVDYMIRERAATGEMAPATRRAEYFPLHLVEPLEQRRSMIGVDLSANPRVAALLAYARDSGKAKAWLAGVDAILPGTQTSMMVLRPVYLSESPLDSVAARRTALLGFAVIEIDLQATLDQLINSHLTRTLRVGLFELPGDSGADAETSRSSTSTPTDARLAACWGDCPTALSAWSDQTHSRTQINFSGTKALVIAQSTREPVALGGFAATLMLSGLLIAFIALTRARERLNLAAALGREREQLRQQVIEKTAAHAQAERLSRAAEASLRSAIESIPEGIVIYDEQDRLVIFNRRFREMFPIAVRFMTPGMHFEEVLRQAIAAGQFPEAAGREEAWLANRLREHREAFNDFEEELPGGRWVRTTDRRTESGMTVGLRTDITELKKESQEARLQAAGHERRYRHLFDSTSAAILVQQEDMLLDVNESACRILGFEREELLQAGVAGIVTAEFTSAYMQRYRETLTGTGEDSPLEFQAQCKNGQTRWLSASMKPLIYSETPAVLVTAVDVTERKAIEANLAHAQKMEAIGQLTGGLAHDFNNLLGVIVGNLDLIGNAFESDPRMKKRVDVALGAALRGSNLTQALLAVARRQTLTPEPVELVGHIRELLPLIQTSAGKSIELVDASAERDVPVLADVGGLDTAVLNLIVNARDAILDNLQGLASGGGGKITLNIESRHIGDRKDHQTPEGLPPGRYAVVSVTDNGCGMTAEQLERVIEPFFTTKENGTGLGLAMVYGFCRQSGGDLKIYSEKGWGTSVRLFLPMLESVGSTEQPQTRQEITGGTARVLVVDDESGLLEVAEHWLDALGYQVSAFEDSTEAAKALERQQFDLLLTDLVMPVINGYRLASIARELQPGIGVLYMSGFAAPSISGDAKVKAEVLEKPFMRAALADAVQRALQDAPSAHAAKHAGEGI